MKNLKIEWYKLNESNPTHNVKEYISIRNLLETLYALRNCTPLRVIVSERKNIEWETVSEFENL